MLTGHDKPRACCGCRGREAALAGSPGRVRAVTVLSYGDGRLGAAGNFEGIVRRESHGDKAASPGYEISRDQPRL